MMPRVGFGERLITPAPGGQIPGLFEARFARGTADDLYVRACVLEGDKGPVAFVQVDAIALGADLVANARRAIERMCGVPGRNCMIAATHTHSGGPTVSIFGSEKSTEYCAFVETQIAAAVSESRRKSLEARIGANCASAPGIAFNRRFVMRDGSQRTHPGKLNPDIVDAAGPADPTVTLLGFREPGAMRPLGCIVHFACHSTHMNGELYSADYAKYIVDTLRAVYGPEFGVVFLNGACADVTQVDNRSGRPGEFGAYWCERTGRAVGAAAIQALAKTDYWLDASIESAAKTIKLPIREIPTAALHEARAILRRNDPRRPTVDALFASELLLVADMRRDSPMRSATIQAIRAGDCAFWSVPGELFQAFAVDASKKSPFRRTCCVSLANGYEGYICTREAFAGGGYEVRTARSSLLEPDAGGAIVNAAVSLLNRLAHSAKDEIARLPESIDWIAEKSDALDGITQQHKRRR